jgi:hypothetical protein
MNKQLCQCLDDLANRIDEKQEEAVHASWDAFLANRITDEIFTPIKRASSPTRVDWPTTPVNQTLHDPQLMAMSQFKGVSDVLEKGGNSLLNVRCNYGVSIMTSQLGCQVVEMPDGQDNTPTTMALNGEEALRDTIQKGVPNLRNGQGADVWDTAELFLEIQDKWPVLGRWVSLYHPDTQGPMDNAELAWGSEIFLAFYDSPQLVHDFLELMTEHYLAFMSKWFEMVKPGANNVHWGLKHAGTIVLRDDSLMNLSPEIYKEFIRDREARCLRELGGGMIHFCGRGDHFIALMSQMKGDGLTAINMSQPHLNDMEMIYQYTVDQGIKIIDLDPAWVQKAVDLGRRLYGHVACPRG